MPIVLTAWSNRTDEYAAGNEVTVGILSSEGVMSDETDGLLLEAAVLDVEGRLLEVLVLTADEGLEDDAPPEDDVLPVLPPLGFGSSVLPISPEVPVDTVASDVVLSDELLGGTFTDGPLPDGRGS